MLNGDNSDNSTTAQQHNSDTSDTSDNSGVATNIHLHQQDLQQQMVWADSSKIKIYYGPLYVALFSSLDKTCFINVFQTSLWIK